MTDTQRLEHELLKLKLSHTKLLGAVSTIPLIIAQAANYAQSTAYSITDPDFRESSTAERESLFKSLQELLATTTAIAKEAAGEDDA